MPSYTSTTAAVPPETNWRDSALRLQFLDQLATDLAAKNKTTKAAELLKKLTNISKQKQRDQQIQKARRKLGKGLVTKLTRKTPDGEVVFEDQQDL
jgi:2,3-bisphosphoglycerate-independent phosphoglycerate mutase